MTEATLDGIAAAKVFLDGLGLSGAFYDHQIVSIFFSHALYL